MSAAFGIDTPEYQQYLDKVTGRHLPVIIDSPGLYRTRAGFPVRIHAIEGPGTANCKGTAYPPPRPGRFSRRPSYEIYQPNGRYRFCGEHNWDIVKKEKT
jgi:hypothetical protein